LRTLTANIVSAHVSNHRTLPEGLPALISAVFQTLATVTAAPARQPKVPATQSVFPDYIICLEDGKKFQMLKGHLKASFQMTPAEYRAKWRLPSDYPMVAPNYSARRSQIASSIRQGWYQEAKAAN
jgi:predicted transcriptional regulator